jgi:hypothetical protein
MSSLTPQEKKRLSYERDRRNIYRRNAKSSRKAIPLRKQEARQNDRSVAKRVFSSALVAEELLADDSVENRIALHQAKMKRTRWRKTPDAPLGAVLKHGKCALALRHK